MPQLEDFCKKQNFQPSFAFNLFCEKKHRIDKQPVAIIGGIAFIAPVVCRVKSVTHKTANPIEFQIILISGWPRPLNGASEIASTMKEK